MTTLNFDITVNASKDDAWKTLADFAGISVFHPTVPTSYTINSTAGTGLGAERRCEFNSDGSKYIDERITRFVDGKEYDVEIYGGTQMPPVNNLSITLGIESISLSQTRVYVRASYQPKYGPVGMVMNMLMIKPFISKALNGILLGFKHHMETGQQVQSFGTLKAAGLVA